MANNVHLASDESFPKKQDGRKTFRDLIFFDHWRAKNGVPSSDVGVRSFAYYKHTNWETMKKCSLILFYKLQFD